MKDVDRAVKWIALLVFVCFLASLFFYGREYQKGARESREIVALRNASSVALSTVYQKLIAGKTNGVNRPVTIEPEDLRRALAQGTNEHGELPASLTGDRIYIAKEGVPLNSGKFVALVFFGVRRFPYGLTSKGECRYAEVGEVNMADYTPLQASKGE